MINLLIVDDHAVVRRGVREILMDEPDMHVSETGSGRAALKLIKENAFDLVLLDLGLPGKNGLEILKEIKQVQPLLPVLVLSVYPEDQFAIRVLKAGAAGFVPKDAAPEDLVQAVRKVLGGGKHVSDVVAGLLLHQVTNKSNSVPHEMLSDREFQILCLLGAGKTVSSIARDLSLSVPTVSTYRARLLDKMHMTTTAELVKYAIENRLTLK